jgi:Tfp pilus assembly protein PilF
MSTTLNLVDRLLARGRRLRQAGRTFDALSLFHRLATFRDLPIPVAEETQLHLAELRLDGRQFRRARRHLTAALRHRPHSAHYHYLMATAVSGDGRGDPQRAEEHYRRALDLDPNHSAYLCAYGWLALQLGRRDEGLACLRRAVELAPDDPDTLGRLVDGLCLAGQAEEAQAVLRAALFRNPRDARCRRLWSDFQFQQLRKQQTLARCVRDSQRAEEEPVLLPFAPPADGAPRSRKRIRQDAPAAVPPPHEAEVLRLSPQRHAQ